jgi:hypothetical protein
MINKTDGAIAKLARYQGQAERSYLKAHGELKKSKAAADKADKPNDSQPHPEAPQQNEPDSPQEEPLKEFHVEFSGSPALRL